MINRGGLVKSHHRSGARVPGLINEPASVFLAVLMQRRKDFKELREEKRRMK